MVIVSLKCTLKSKADQLNADDSDNFFFSLNEIISCSLQIIGIAVINTLNGKIEKRKKKKREEFH